MKGKFIVIYGVNNLGKTTQVRLLTKYLRQRGKAVEYVKYPIYALKPSGVFINEYLRLGKHRGITAEQFQLWCALNRLQFEPRLKRWLDHGIWVVAEDYKGTGIAWGTAAGADLNWLEMLNQPQLEPDTDILLDGERFGSGKEARHAHEHNDDLIQKSRKIHLKLAKKYDWQVVDSNQPVEKVHQDIVKLIL